MEIKVECFDSANRPKKIPKNKWLTKGQTYTIYDVVINPDKTILGVLLKEVKMDSSCAPYQVYSLSRFKFMKRDIEEFDNFVKNKIKTLDI